MKQLHLLIHASLLILSCQTVTAYETQTHALITAAAYDRSVLSQTGDTSVVSRLLLDRLFPSDPFKPYWMPSQPTTYFSDHTGGLPSLNEPAGQHLSSAATQLGTVASGFIGPRYAQILVLRENSDQTRSGYHVQMIHGADGVWRIESL